MTFQDDNGNIIQFNGEFQMNKNGVTLLNGFKIKGDVSVNFSVDNNSINRKILGYDGPQMRNQVAWTKQAFNRSKDGNILDRGYICIQNDNDGVSLSCFYVSGNSNWVNSFSGLITDLNWDDYYDEFTSATVMARVGATEGIVYPMVDWTNALKRGYNGFRMDKYNPVFTDIFIPASYCVVDKSNDPEKSLFDFYPCLYLKTLVDEIIKQNGFKLSGDLIEDKLYQSLIISPISGEMRRDSFKNVLATGASFAQVSTPLDKYDQFTAVIDPDNAFSGSTYTAVRKAGLIFTTTIVASSTTTAQIHLFKNGVDIGQWEMSLVGDVQSFQLHLADPGDVFEIYIANSPGDTITLNLEIKIPETIRVGDYVNPVNFLPKGKCIDWLKAVFGYFGCELEYNEFSKTISANIIENIKLEDADDWSEYYLGHTSNYDNAAKKNYLKFTDAPDADLVHYNKVNETGYGNGLIETTSELKPDNPVFTLPFIPSGFDKDINGSYQSNSPIVRLKDADIIPFTNILNSGSGLITLVFGASNTVVLNPKEIVRVVTSLGENLGYLIVDTDIGLPSISGALFYYPFIGDMSGYIVRQEIEYVESAPRLLVNKPSTNYSDFTTTLGGAKPWNTGFDLYDEGGTRNAETTIAYAYFCKRFTGLAIDSFPANCAFLNPSEVFVDPDRQHIAFNKISNIIKNPTVKFRFRLPEAVFANASFSRFKYVKSKNLDGYFMLETIENYQDAANPVNSNNYLL